MFAVPVAHLYIWGEPKLTNAGHAAVQHNNGLRLAVRVHIAMRTAIRSAHPRVFVQSQFTVELSDDITRQVDHLLI